MRCIRHIIATLAGTMLIALLQPGIAMAQDAQLTQYWAMPTYYNPAAVGNTDYLRIRGGAKLQWLGITHAPQDFLATADVPFKLIGKRFGAGVTFNQENIGLFSNLQVNAQLAFKLQVLKGELSIAVQPGYVNRKFKGTEVDISGGNDDYHEGNDEAIPTQDLTGNHFDLGAGVFYTHKWFWFGIGGQHLLGGNVTLSTEGSTASEETSQYEIPLVRTIYFSGGSNIPIKNTLFEIQPSFLIKTDFRVFTAELTLRTRYNKFLSGGLAYRYNEALSVMLGVEFKNFFIGYAYDYPLSKINRGSSGSHELLAGYQMKLDFSAKNKNKHRSIRIM